MCLALPGRRSSSARASSVFSNPVSTTGRTSRSSTRYGLPDIAIVRHINTHLNPRLLLSQTASCDAASNICYGRTAMMRGFWSSAPSAPNTSGHSCRPCRHALWGGGGGRVTQSKFVD
jgi:hypothetical protein